MILINLDSGCFMVIGILVDLLKVLKYYTLFQKLVIICSSINDKKQSEKWFDFISFLVYSCYYHRYAIPICAVLMLMWSLLLCYCGLGFTYFDCIFFVLASPFIYIRL